MQILKFTLLRLALAVVFFAGFHYLGMGILLAIAAGILCSAMVSFIFFPAQGNAAAEQLRSIVESRPKRPRVDEVQEELEAEPEPEHGAGTEAGEPEAGAPEASAPEAETPEAGGTDSSSPHAG